MRILNPAERTGLDESCYFCKSQWTRTTRRVDGVSGGGETTLKPIEIPTSTPPDTQPHRHDSLTARLETA